MAQLVKNLHATLKIQVQSLGQEDPLEEGMATHSSILAWRIPWREDPGSPWGCKESGMTEQLTHIHRFILSVLIELYSLACSITTLACILLLTLFKIFIFLFYLFFWILFYYLTLQYCIGFAIYQHESATGIHVFPILNPLPSSFPVPSLWVIPVHQPQASSIVHRTLFHIWYYTCFNAILPNHPTLSLSHRVQKTVLYISDSFAVSYTRLFLPSF